MRTIKNKTFSGEVTVQIKQLDIADKNAPQNKLGYNEPSDATDEIELDMAQPWLETVIYRDVNKNAEVDSRDELVLTFNEPMKKNTSDEELIKDFILSPGNNTLGGEPNFFFENNQVIITLGNDSVLSPEGRYQEDGERPSGLKIKTPNNHIIDKAGNTLLNSSILDIDIEDKKKPTISSSHQEGLKINAIPTFEFYISDESTSFDSGINLDMIGFSLNESSLNWKEIEKPTETLINSIPTTILNVEVFAPESKVASTSVPSKFTKHVKLRVIFDEQNPLLGGKYELGLSIRDNKGNEASKKIGFIVSSETDIITDLATYPNPFAIGQETAVIRYLLSKDVNDVIINIYDVSGRLVWTQKTSGINGLNDQIRWNGQTKQGNDVSAGIYICELIAEGDYKYWRIAVRPPE